VAIDELDPFLCPHQEAQDEIIPFLHPHQELKVSLSLPTILIKWFKVSVSPSSSQSEKFVLYVLAPDYHGNRPSKTLY
jgi:hypothetical protein